jgi:hypothetical protein
MRPATPARAARKKCLHCSGDSPKEVRLCKTVECPLWAWRFAKRPSTIRASKPWLLDVEIVPQLAEAEGFRELHHETGESTYLASFREKVAVAIAKYPRLANERHARIAGDGDESRTCVTRDGSQAGRDRSGRRGRSNVRSP